MACLGMGLIVALVEVLRAIENHTHLYWGTTYPEEDTWHAREHWGSGYIMTMDLVYWIATSEIPPTRTVGAEDWITWWWLTQGIPPSPSPSMLDGC